MENPTSILLQQKFQFATFAPLNPKPNIISALLICGRPCHGTNTQNYFLLFLRHSKQF
jgi:hypothetical protein